MTSHHRPDRSGSHVFFKLFGVAATCLFPVAILAFLTVSALLQQIALTRGELAGVDYGQSAMELVRAGVECRQVTDEYLHDRATRAELETAQARVDDLLRVLDMREAAFAAANGTAPREALSALKSRWAAVTETAAKARPGPRPDSQLIQDQNEWLARARDLHAAIGDASLLLHDPDRTARHASGALAHLLDDADHLSQLQLFAANAAQRKTLRADELAALHRLAGRVAAAGEAYDAAWTAAARARPDFAAPLATANDERNGDRTAFVALVAGKVLAPTLIDTTPRALRDAGQKAVARDFDMYARLTPALETDLYDRVELRRSQIKGVLVCVGAGLVLTLVAAFVVARGMKPQEGNYDEVNPDLRKAIVGVQEAAAAVQAAAGGGSAGGPSRQVEENVQRIGRAVQRIDDVADRASILATNASIRAATAGEAGRGFAAVATEFERLAEECAGATREIETSIKAMQSEPTDKAEAAPLTAAVERLTAATRELERAATPLQSQ